MFKKMIFVFGFWKKKIFRLLQGKPFYTNRQEDLLDQLQSGDIVFSRMPLSAWDLYDIPEGHRNRPYVVLEKDESGLWGLACTSQAPKSRYRAQYYNLPQERYQTFEFYGKERVNIKDSYVKLTEPIFVPIENLMQKTNHLEEVDAHCMQRKILKLTNNYSGLRFLHTDTPVDIGDIISHEDSFFYIYQIYKNDVHGYRLAECDKDHIHALPYKIRGKYYQFFINEPKHMNVSELKIEQIIRMGRNGEAKKFKKRIRDRKFYQKKKAEKTSRYKEVDVNLIRRKIHFVLPIGTELYQERYDDSQYYLFSIGNRSYGFFSEDLQKVRKNDHAKFRIKELVMEDYSQLRPALHPLDSKTIVCNNAIIQKDLFVEFEVFKQDMFTFSKVAENKYLREVDYI